MRFIEQIATKLNVNSSDITVAFSVAAFALIGFIYTQFFDNRNSEKERVDMLSLVARYDSVLKIVQAEQSQSKNNSNPGDSIKYGLSGSVIDADTIDTKEINVNDTIRSNSDNVEKDKPLIATSSYNSLKDYESEKKNQQESSFEEYKPKELPKEKININKAPKDDLMRLPGIGNSTAEKIIEYRGTTLFNTPEDIMEVNGIGEKKFEKLKKYIRVR